MEDSVKYCLQAKAYPQAASIIEQIGMGVLRRGRTGDMAQWLESLPRDLVQENPWLLLFSSMTRPFMEVKDDAPRLQKAFALFEERGNPKGQLLSLAYLIEKVIARGRDLVPLAVLLEQGEVLLGALTSDAYSCERASLWLQIGFGNTFRSNPRKGYWACQNAYLLSKNLDDLPLQLKALVYAVFALSALGEFSLAHKVCKIFEKTAAEHAAPKLRTLYHIAASQLLIQQGALDEAAAIVDEARRETEKQGQCYDYPVTFLYDLVSKALLGSFAEAKEAGSRLLNASWSMDNPFLYGYALLFLGLCHYHQEDFQIARVMLEQSREILSSDEARSDWYLSLNGILMAPISYHLEEGERAETDLQQALDYHRNLSSSYFMAQSHFAMALLKWQQGNAKDTTTHLGAGLKIAKERGYEHFTLLSRPDLVKVCALAIELHVEEVGEYAVYLLSKRFTPQADLELKRLSCHRKQNVRGKAQEIQRAIHRKDKLRLPTETRRGFRVRGNQFLVKDGKWKGSEPKGLSSEESRLSQMTDDRLEQKEATSHPRIPTMA
jgi:hypothetical protein